MITTKTCTILNEKTTDRMCSKYRHLTQVFIKNYNCQKHQIHRFHKNTNAQQVVETHTKAKLFVCGGLK